MEEMRDEIFCRQSYFEPRAWCDSGVDGFLIKLIVVVFCRIAVLSLSMWREHLMDLLTPS